MNTSQPETTNVERLLAAAGIDFTVVDRCPHPTCELCVRSEASVAA